MLQVVCTVRSFDPASDTCSVELQGLGIVDAWLDGIAIAQPVDRSYIVFGASGVVVMPDLHRICEATLIQVTPPGTPVSGEPDPIVIYTGYATIATDAFGNGCVDVTFPTPYSETPLVTASADSLLHLALSNISETGFTACITGGKPNAHHHVAYTAKSKKTSTATTNKALTVLHDGDKVGTAFKLDFEDGAQITFGADYDDVNKSNVITAFLTPAFLAMLEAAAGGGALSMAIATHFDQPSSTTTLDTATNWTLLPAFETTYIDTDAYFDAAHPTRLTAPAEGTYHITFIANWGGILSLPDPMHALDDPNLQWTTIPRINGSYPPEITFGTDIAPVALAQVQTEWSNIQNNRGDSEDDGIPSQQNFQQSILYETDLKLLAGDDVEIEHALYSPLGGFFGNGGTGPTSGSGPKLSLFSAQFKMQRLASAKAGSNPTTILAGQANDYTDLNVTPVDWEFLLYHSDDPTLSLDGTSKLITASEDGHKYLGTFCGAVWSFPGADTTPPLHGTQVSGWIQVMKVGDPGVLAEPEWIAITDEEAGTANSRFFWEPAAGDQLHCEVHADQPGTLQFPLGYPNEVNLTLERIA